MCCTPLLNAGGAKAEVVVAKQAAASAYLVKVFMVDIVDIDRQQANQLIPCIDERLSELQLCRRQIFFEK